MSHHNVALSERRLRNIQVVLMDKQEMRMRSIQLMNDAQKSLGRKETINIIKDLACLGKTYCLVLFLVVNLFLLLFRWCNSVHIPQLLNFCSQLLSEALFCFSVIVCWRKYFCLDLTLFHPLSLSS